MGYLLILRHSEVSSGALLCLNHSLHALILINQLVLALDAVYSAAMVSFCWRWFVLEGRYWAVHRVHSISQPWSLDWRLAKQRRGVTTVRILPYLHHHLHNWLIGELVVCWTLRRWFRNDAKRSIRDVLGRISLAPVSLYKGLLWLEHRTIPLLLINRGLPCASLSLIKTNFQLFVLLFITIVDCNWSLSAGYLLYEYLAPILVIDQLVSRIGLLMMFAITLTACRG